MANDNNINVESIGGIGNTINIAQHHAPTTPHIEYTISSGTVEHLSQPEVRNGALVFYGSLALPILAIISDGLGFLSFLGIQSKWVLAVLFPIAVIGALLTSTKGKIAALFFFDSNKQRFINGRWVKPNSQGGYVLYKKTAPCIYPKCSGTVFIRTAPPRERHNHDLVGVCDTDGIRHTYTVDANGIGFPQNFDWRPKEEVKP